MTAGVYPTTRIISGQPQPKEVRRLAAFRALALGDLLLAAPALRALRRGFPSAEITLIGLPWAADFARRYHAVVDRFVVFEGYPGIRESRAAPGRVSDFLAEQRAYGYDLVIQMHGSGSISNPCALAFGGETTAGYYDADSPGGARLARIPHGLTYAAPYPHGAPEVMRNLGLARLVGCEDLDPTLFFPLEEADHAEAAALLARLPGDGRPLVGLHVGASIPARRWPVERFAAVADWLAHRWGAQVILTGGADEAPLAQAVAARMTAPALVVAGETTLGGLGALLARLDLFIGNDTGPAHLAEAVGAASVTIFGPASTQRWGPLDRAQHPVVRVPVACSPCAYAECPIEHPCVRRITPEMVIAEAERLLARRSAPCDA